MKKLTTILVPLAIIALMFSAQFSFATYGVNVGDTFTYDVIKSEIDVTVGTDSAHAEGYSIDGHHFAQGTSVNLEVTAVSSSVEYEVSSGSYMEPDDCSTFGFLFGAIFMIVYPMLITVAFADFDNWNQTAAEEDPGILMSPFVDNDTSTWQGFKDLADDVQTGTPLSTEGIGDFYFNATYVDDVNNFLFESYMGGTFDMNNTVVTDTYFINAEIEHHFQFAFQKATGVMLGMRMEGSVVGTTNGTAIDVQYSQHTEKAGYNLPGYTFGGGFVFIPGFEWFVGITAIASLCVLPILIRRKK